VSFRPRIRYRNIVLARKSWSTDVSTLPRRGPEMSESDWLLEWRRWQAAHGVPDQVFATFYPSTEGDDGKNPMAARNWMMASKPHYVDFMSFYALQVFDSLMRSNGGIVALREMLPAEDDLYVTSERGHHVTELAVELTLMNEGALT